MAANVGGKFHFRLVLLGSNGTGFLFKKFETKYKPTVEDLFCKDFDLGSIEIKVDFLDTSGSMQFPAMRRLSITTGNAFLIVYSVDDDSSFEVLKMCIAEIQEIRPDYQEIPIVFAGNKCELPKEQRKVSKETVSNYVHYEVTRLRTKVIECSCKEDLNVEAIFRAYLSLARVPLSSAVSVNLKSRPANSSPGSSSGAGLGSHRFASKQPTEEQIDECEQQSTGLVRNASVNSARRASSMKVALGVRKSCDASIITSMKNVSITVTPDEHNKGAGQHRDQQQQQNSGLRTSSLEQQQQQHQEQQTNQQTTSQIVLERAIKSGMGLAPRDSGKPRSRSLIWRPSARRSRKSANQQADQECRVS